MRIPASEHEGLILPESGERGAVILISGGRRAGKTTLLLRLRAVAGQGGRRVGGFLSVARFEGGEKTGIDLMDAATGATMPLASMSGEGAIRTGHYTFNPAALDAGIQIAEAGRDADVLFVDELGPLELVRGEGWASVLPIVRAREYGIAFVAVRPELIGQARAALTLPDDSPLVMVSEANREAVFAPMADWLRRRMERAQPRENTG
ncbi:MAG: hypothetical protein JW910_01475 [Anaerolineae bacterium]|nr:hypothetical protein [Anaerolineae bacterium]